VATELKDCCRRQTAVIQQDGDGGVPPLVHHLFPLAFQLGQPRRPLPLRFQQSRRTTAGLIPKLRPRLAVADSSRGRCAADAPALGAGGQASRASRLRHVERITKRWNPIATASPSSVSALAPVCSPLSATVDLIAGVDAFVDDALNVFGEMGTMYASFSLLLFFPFNIWLLFYIVPISISCTKIDMSSVISVQLMGRWLSAKRMRLDIEVL